MRGQHIAKMLMIVTGGHQRLAIGATKPVDCIARTGLLWRDTTERVPGTGMDSGTANMYLPGNRHMVSACGSKMVSYIAKMVLPMCGKMAAVSGTSTGSS
jgi:hypothetical protein